MLRNIYSKTKTKNNLKNNLTIVPLIDDSANYATC